MEIDRYNEIDELLAGFPYGLLQDFMTFIRYIDNNDLQISEVSDYLDMKLDILTSGDKGKGVDKKGRSIEKLIKKLPKCPVCGLPLSIEPINNSPRRMVGGKANSWWICPDPYCSHEPQLDERLPREALESIGIVDFSHHRKKAARRKMAAMQKKRGDCARTQQKNPNWRGRGR